MNVYLACVAGVALSILIPTIRKAVVEAFPSSMFMSLGPGGGGHHKSMSKIWKTVWPAVKPYLLLGIFSAIIALLIVAFAGESLSTWRQALIAGYVSDSTLQKLKPSS